MKFGFKHKVMAAAVALAASTGANAAVTGSELVFFAANGTTNSVLFDLGINMGNFLTGNNSTIVWDFDANGGLGSVTGSAPGGPTLNYGNIWSASGFSFSSSTRWGVIGADAIAGDLVSTSANAPSVVGSTQNDPGFEASVDVPGVYFNAANFLASGTHDNSDNGANFADSTSGSALHAQGFLSANQADDRWRAKTPFSASLSGAGEMPFYRLAYDLAGGGTSPMLLTTYAGLFSFDPTTARLTYSVSEIPEPSAYALLAAGLVMVGAIARRRVNA